MCKRLIYRSGMMTDPKILLSGNHELITIMTLSDIFIFICLTFNNLFGKSFYRIYIE